MGKINGLQQVWNRRRFRTGENQGQKPPAGRYLAQNLAGAGYLSG